MTRQGGLKVAFYRQGAEFGKPTVQQWSTSMEMVWELRCQPGLAAHPYALLAVELRIVMDRIDGWVLATARPGIDQVCFGPVPVLFRFGAEADLLPTGVIPFEVPIFDWDAKPPKHLGSEMWHVTLRGCGAT